MKLKLVIPFFFLFCIGSCLRQGRESKEELLASPVAIQDAGASTELPPIEVLFSPHGGCGDMVVSFINGAKTSLKVQAYSFTSAPIIDALIQASQKPGMKVDVILDRSDEGSVASQKLIDAGIHVVFDEKHPIAHNKVIVRDETETEEGSYNYTNQAENNAENCNIIRYLPAVKKYSSNFDLHMTHSGPATKTKAKKKRK